MVAVSNQAVNFTQIRFILLNGRNHRLNNRFSSAIFKRLHGFLPYSCFSPTLLAGISISVFSSSSSFMTVSVAPIISSDVK